jgi:hypothetical protein
MYRTGGIEDLGAGAFLELLRHGGWLVGCWIEKCRIFREKFENSEQFQRAAKSILLIGAF